MLRLEGIKKSFGSTLLFDNLNLSINAREFVTVLGPSGCGKSTILRLIGGMEKPDRGRIILEDQDITNTPSQKRAVNTVFQSYALFPHLSVFENIAFGLRAQRVGDQEITSRVMNALAMVHLSDLMKRMPRELSGGEQQRVALARALVGRPKVLLLDESLSALDKNLREAMQRELKAMQRELPMSFILVTHDQDEALALGDRVVVLNRGAIVQTGTPFEIYENPVSRFVAKFLGQPNIFAAEFRENGRAFIPELGVEVPMSMAVGALRRGYALIKAHRIRIEPPEACEHQATIVDRGYKGSILEITMTTDSGANLFVRLGAPSGAISHFEIGARVSWEALFGVPLNHD